MFHSTAGLSSETFAGVGARQGTLSACRNFLYVKSKWCFLGYVQISVTVTILLLVKHIFHMISNHFTFHSLYFYSSYLHHVTFYQSSDRLACPLCQTFTALLKPNSLKLTKKALNTCTLFEKDDLCTVFIHFHHQCTKTTHNLK